MPVDQIAVEELAAPGLVVQFGFPPERIDIITSIDGVTFAEAWPNRIEIVVEGRRHPVIGKQDLIRNKRAAAHPQDLVDADALERPD